MASKVERSDTPRQIGVFLRMPVSLHKDLMDQADKEMGSMAQVIRKACVRYVASQRR